MPVAAALYTLDLDLHCQSSPLGDATVSGADPGFLERGCIYIKVWGFALLILSHLSKISHENEIIWSH